MFRNSSSILSLLVVLLACLGALGSPSYRTFNKRSQVAARNPDADTWSNAERLARGLSPRKPGTLFNPTRVARTVPQPSGVQPVTRFIQVRKASNSQSLGHVRSNLDNGRYTVTSGSGNRLSVKFTPASGPFQIEINDSQSYRYLGFAGSSSLAPTNSNGVSVVRTNTVPSGSTPTNSGNSLGGASESYVWSYNSGSGELTAQWVNPSGSPISVNFFYDDDTGLYASANSNYKGYTRVRLYTVV